MDILSDLSSRISLFHLNTLFLLGLALFGGTIGGRIFQKLKIPQVVGYIIIGIIIGQSGFKVVDKNTVKMLQPFNSFALGLIGFMIGGELKKEVFKQYGRQFMYILFFEGVLAFAFVTIFIGIANSIFFGNSGYSWALAILLGAIAASTAPASTTGVLWEYKAKGPLTTTVLGIVALDDGLALLLFAVASSVAASILGKSNGFSLLSFFAPLYEIGGALLIGILFGLTICKMRKRHNEQDKILAFSIGVILLLVGTSRAIEVDMILAAMCLGAVVVNFSPKESGEVFKLVEKFTPPIYVLFFVLVGAKLNLSKVNYYMAILVIIYLLSRAFGKVAGATLGARISKAPETVRKYLPLCLLSQAGVAIGLSIFANQQFPGEIGNTIIIVIACTTFVVELIGPPFVKIAILKAGEAGLNITEDDLIRKATVKDIMAKEARILHEDMPLKKILKIFSEGNELFYPVVNKENDLRGMVTVNSIKNTLMLPELSGFLLANDIMEPVVTTVSHDILVTKAQDLLKAHDLESLPVVTKENKVLGVIESRDIKKLISKKIVELQNKIESLNNQ